MRGVTLVKKIEVILRPNKMIELEEALKDVVTGMTVTHVKGFGTQKGETQVYRGTPVTVNLLPKMKMETIVTDDKVEEFVGIIQRVCQTGKYGDGKIFIIPVEEAIRIRTGEKGHLAL